MIKNRIFNNPIYPSWLNVGVQVLKSIIILPFILSVFSSQQVTVWFLLLSIISITNTIVTGFASSFVRFISYSFSGVKLNMFNSISTNFKPYGDLIFDQGEFSSIIIVLKRIVRILTVIVFFVLACLGTLALYKPIQALNNPIEGWVEWLFIVILSTATLGNSYHRIILEGLNFIKKIEYSLFKINTVALLILIALILIIKAQFVLIVVYYYSVNFTIILYFSFLSKNQLRSMDISLDKYTFRPRVFKIIWFTIWKNGFTSIVASIINNISGIIVANLLNSEQSSSFLLTKRIFEIIDQFCRSTFKAYIPKIASLRGGGFISELKTTIYKISFLQYSVFILLYLALILFGEYFLELISSNTSIGSKDLIILFSFSTKLNAVARNSTYVMFRGRGYGSFSSVSRSPV